MCVGVCGGVPHHMAQEQGGFHHVCRGVGLAMGEGLIMCVAVWA